ncbi:MAG: hypothetical protein AB1414_18935 [bacterium]
MYSPYSNTTFHGCENMVVIGKQDACLTFSVELSAYLCRLYGTQISVFWGRRWTGFLGFYFIYFYPVHLRSSASFMVGNWLNGNWLNSYQLPVTN